jgi:hypothetical protein
MDARKKYFNVVDREILKNLLKQGSIKWYFFHEKYRLSPGQLSRSLNKLEALEFVIIKDDEVTITKEGRAVVVLERNNILRITPNENWKIIQDYRVGKKLELNEFYLPIKKKMQK